MNKKEKEVFVKALTEELTKMNVNFGVNAREFEPENWVVQVAEPEHDGVFTLWLKITEIGGSAFAEEQPEKPLVANAAIMAGNENDTHVLLYSFW